MSSSLPKTTPHASINSRAGSWWLFFMGMFLACAGLLFTWVLWRAYQRAEETRHWPTVPCVILSSKVTEERPSPQSNLTYRAEVTYLYDFAGKTHSGNHIRRLDTPTVHEKVAQKRVAEWTVGLRTVCYVNPNNPQQAVLQHTTRAALYSIWFPILFVVGGLIMALKAVQAALRSPKASEMTKSE